MGITTIKDWHLDQDEPEVSDAAERDDYFGTAVAIADFNGDGYEDLAVGVPNEDIGNVANGGAVHVFYGGPSGILAVSPDDVLWHQDSPSVRDIFERGDQLGTSGAAG
jgi:hypothetical protein